MIFIKKYWLHVVIIITLVVLLNRCGKSEPTIKIVTETEYIDRVDTITRVVIKEVPTTVYLNRIKTIKGKDSIVYVKQFVKGTIKANQYETELQSNNATAKLKITTTGELLDVQGVISYKEKVTTITKTIERNKSGLFLYAETSINPLSENIEVGLDYVIKNKFIIGTSASYNNVTKSINLNAKIGIKLF